MSPTFVSSFLLAGVLGVRHGLDVDHLAAIDGLSRAYTTAGKLLLARLSGLLFSIGHGLVVMAAALALRGRADGIPAWLEGAGSLISIALLVFLGLLNLLQAFRGEGGVASPLAATLLKIGSVHRFAGALVTGVLFALSFDTFTLAAWLGTAGAASGSDTGSAVLLLALSFVGGMVFCDGLNGLWVAHLIRRSKAFAERARRLFSALVATIALSVATLELVRMRWQVADAWLDARGLWLSGGVLGVLLIGFCLAAGTRSLARSADVGKEAWVDQNL